ncbi:carbohydrate ABC transporter permease [Desnuesiella massiliensis]|uniref:carbohydrate ABC transporter permease n=1 Tax=Desnuesiella massiliensis TaxID=1650662 RepID=UPI000AE4BAE4|nr:sugar ABC transporter permease [Desnuesiella massiliensis]
MAREIKTEAYSFNANKRPLFKKILRELKLNLFSYLIVSIVLIHFLIFKIIPFIGTFVLSFLDYRFIGKSKFIGLKNWSEMLSDPVFYKSLWNTLLFTIYYVLPTLVLGLILALLINYKNKNTTIFKIVYFLPVVTSFVVVAGIWKWIFTSYENGIANYFLKLFRVPPQRFLADTKVALLVLAGLSIFKVAGSVMIYYYGGLKQIPESLYEAAEIDGATGLKKFFHITLPLLKPTTLYVAIMTTIGSFQIFDSAYLLTGGGPNYSTTTIVYYIYQQAFVQSRLGYASALSFVLFIIILVISILQKKTIGGDASYY